MNIFKCSTTLTRLNRGICYLVLTSLSLGCATSANKIPRTEVAPSSSSAAQDQAVYTVRKGDTLAAIARKYAVSAQQLQYRNDISDPTKLAINTRLYIPYSTLRVPTDFARHAGFIWPVNWSNISSEFGARSGRHAGSDLRAPAGTPVRAAADGTVAFAGSQRGYGNTVIIQHSGGVKTLYGHNQKNLVKKGQKVFQGNVIAIVGRSGNASGYHVHFEYIRGGRKLNPRNHVRNFYGL